MQCNNKEEFDITFCKYNHFYIVSRLWKILSSIIDITTITKLSNTTFDTSTEPIWFILYKLYILNRSFSILITKEFVSKFKEYIQKVIHKLTIEPVLIYNNTTTATIQYQLDTNILSNILIYNDS
jgi:hypothetical protein